MSKILIIADLHLDMWLATGRDPLAALDPEVWAGLEALIIAGDPSFWRISRAISPQSASTSFPATTIIMITCSTVTTG